MENADQIRMKVRQHYGSIAEKHAEKASTGCCGSSKGGGCGSNEISFAEEYGSLEGYYSDADLKLGCGLPTKFAQIKEGNVVLDLGSGAGNDCFVARSIVGENGKVIGVDMTPEMILKARENNVKLAYENVEFRLGEIENLPVESNSVDVVVSNCVLNLVPDKDKALAETYRVLKKGGHFSISDIVIEGDIPEDLRKDVAAYAACVSGAVDKSAYLDKIKNTGFKNIEIQQEIETKIPDEYIEKYFSKYEIDSQEKFVRILSITVYAEK